MNREQKLIDIMFQVALTIRRTPVFKSMTVPQTAGWVAEQLRICGFNTEPVGASWGVLKQKETP